jgi:hypothetical protein
MITQTMAPCGNNCTECPRYIATRNSDTATLKQLAQIWHQCGLNQSIQSVEDMKCTGCNSTKKCGGKINACEKLKHIANCSMCGLYPCDKLRLVLANTQKCKENTLALLPPELQKQFDKAFYQKQENLERGNNAWLIL